MIADTDEFVIREIPSLYAWSEGSVIKDTTSKEKPRDYVDAPGAVAISRALQKHGFLTRRLLKRNLAAYRHGNIDLVRALRKMQQQGRVKKYTIYSEKGDNVSILCLSEEERRRYPDNRGYRYDMTDIPYILEHLSVAQWEISLIKNKTLTERIYEHSVITENRVLRIPCLHRFKNALGRDINLYAIPVCRTGMSGEGLRRFLGNLSDLRTYTEANAGNVRSPQIVIICESVQQIDDITEILYGIAEFSGCYFLYTADSITAGNDPLSMLYGATLLDNGNISLEVVTLKEEKPGETVQRIAAGATEKVREIAAKISTG